MITPHLPSLGRTLLRIVALTVVSSVLPARASLAPYALHASIQGPVKVWVNTGSGVYHCPGTQWYGHTKVGIYLLEPGARARGYRAAYGRTCGPLLATADSTTASPLTTVAPAPTPSLKVWVNTNSGVYHCPGTRYYGATSQGKYMAEGDARAAGNRPAYGRSCS